jgi:hypothetical protein
MAKEFIDATWNGQGVDAGKAYFLKATSRPGVTQAVVPGL